MKCPKLVSLFLICLIVFSLIVLVYSKTNTEEDWPLFCYQSILQEIPRNGLAVLNQTTRMQIYNFITDNPGVNFRGICSSLALPIGVVQYHLTVLDKGNLISDCRDGRNKRFFKSRKFSDTEMKIISALRHETVEKILTILHDEESEAHGKLAQRLEISSQALTWHMKQLQQNGLVTGVAEGMTIKYYLAEEQVDTIKECIKLISN
ncbi:MAG: winged helix-turn-helix transcriptional regulator [Candidatus Bathyarchaeota archaeon]|nr:winged helix-turn-helix transcriptional regulator [Candidatus Bathyarchaeota archaeon]